MANEYRVLKIDELTRVSDLHGIEKYYRHTIKSKGGVVLTVNIDEGDFTPEKTGPILVEKAKQADAILKG